MDSAPEPVPLLDLRAQYRSIASEIDEAIRRVLDGQQFVLGPEVEAFEEEFAAYCGTGFAVGCGSGTDALWLALAALDVGPGDEVVCPAYSFVATASAVRRLGARPVFADVDPAWYTLTPETAERAAARCTRLRAVIPVDLFGLCAPGPGIERLAESLGVPVVGDAAQAVGAVDEGGLRAGARAALGCFSLYPSKNLGAYGEAGIVVGDDPARAARLRSLRAHGSLRPHVHEELGINSRLDALQAAVLRVKLRHLEAWTAARRENAAAYDAAFARAGARPSGEPFEADGLPLRTPRPPAPPARHVYHHYVVRVPSDRRDALRGHLASRGVASEVYYPHALHEQPCMADLAVAPGSLPEAESAARETLALPVHAELRPEQRDRVVEAVLEFLDAARP